jgi:hypothetical protein
MIGKMTAHAVLQGCCKVTILHPNRRPTKPFASTLRRDPAEHGLPFHLSPD